MKKLDVITIGRASVDLYGTQVGGRLEDMGSFQKYIGGSPANMAAGTARLGLAAPEEELAASFRVAARPPLVRGFAVGRTIFAEAAQKWLAREIDDAAAVADMAARFDRLSRLWDEARSAARA